MEIIEIERGSEAWHAIGNAILTGHTLRIAEHTGDTIKVKRDEDMWTPPLSTVVKAVMPKCWCGEPATYAKPCDMLITTANVITPDGQPAIAVCSAHCEDSGWPIGQAKPHNWY